MKSLKEHKKLFIITSIILSIIVICFPILLNNLLLDWRAKSTNGEMNTWISFFATFYGAILGGVISGSLTLIGVLLTVKSSADEKENEIAIQTVKDRLYKFYHPVDSLISFYFHKHGAHEFTELELDEQLAFLTLISENIHFVDSELYILINEMQWSFKAKDYKKLDERYEIINDLVIDHLSKLRIQLKLPKLI